MFLCIPSGRHGDKRAAYADLARAFPACCQFEFDKDCYVQEYVKAQFAGVETHVAIIDLLRRVQPSSSRWPSKTKEIIGRPVMRSLWPITSARRGERLYSISSC